MKKFLSIALSALLMLTVLAVAVSADNAPVMEGTIDFETEYAALDTFYYSIATEGNNHYAKLNPVAYDDGFDVCSRVPFKPLGDVPKYQFTEGSKWVYKCDFHLDIQNYGDKAAAIYIGASRTNVNSQNLNDLANPVFYAPSYDSVSATAFPTEWIPVDGMHDGWNTFELDLTMGADGFALFNILINGTVIHEGCETADFLNDNVYDGLCFAAVHPNFPDCAGANLGVDNIYFACLDAGEEPVIPEETDPAENTEADPSGDNTDNSTTDASTTDAATTLDTAADTADGSAEDKDNSWIIIAAVVAALVVATVVAVVVINKKKK